MNNPWINFVRDNYQVMKTKLLANRLPADFVDVISALKNDYRAEHPLREKAPRNCDDKKFQDHCKDKGPNFECHMGPKRRSCRDSTKEYKAASSKKGTKKGTKKGKTVTGRGGKKVVKKEPGDV